MRTKQLEAIEADSISVAWAKAQLTTISTGVPYLAPLVVAIESNSILPPEVPAIRSLLDATITAVRATLHKEHIHDVATTAGTIFPKSYYVEGNPDAIYDRYKEVYVRRLRKHPANRQGTYFQRMIGFSMDLHSGLGGKNQLKALVESYNGGVKRASLLQAALLDPIVDLNNQPRRGFPCLQQVAFTPLGNGELGLTAMYATQLVFERAYGNYLGLWELGQFIGDQLGLQLTRLTCVAAKAEPFGLTAVTRAKLKPMTDQLEALIDNHHG